MRRWLAETRVYAGITLAKERLSCRSTKKATFASITKRPAPASRRMRARQLPAEPSSHETHRWREQDSNHQFRVTRPRFRDRLTSLLPDCPPTETRREREPTPRGRRVPPAGPMVRILFPPARSQQRTLWLPGASHAGGTQSSNPLCSSEEMLWGGRRGWQFRRLHQSMECRDAPTERFEQVPRGPGPR
jgi:hypothetical protein